MQPTRVVVGRQAIHDRAGATVAYELLFRSTPDEGRPDGPYEASSPEAEGAELTSEVVFAALTIGLQHLVGDKLLYCNADRNVLSGTVPITLPPERTVVEIDGAQPLDEVGLAGCRRLIEQGYSLAVDGFTGWESAGTLLALASVVKLDVQAMNDDALRSTVAQCGPYRVTLLADGIETEDELRAHRELGFGLFQGPLLERPVVVSGRTIEPGHLTRLRMAAVLMSSELDFGELDEMLHSDPGLAFQIMKLAGIGRPGETRRKINTTRDALVIAGTRRVQNWMALLLARPEQAAPDDVLTRTLMRARACELLTQRLDHEQASMGFAAGLLSALDLLLGIPSAELTETLPIGKELAAAAFGRHSELARIVRDAENYQLATPGRQLHSGLAEGDLDEAFAQAFSWTMLSTEALDT